MTAGTSVKMALRHRGGESHGQYARDYGKSGFQGRRISEAPPIVPMPRDMASGKRIEPTNAASSSFLGSYRNYDSPTRTHNFRGVEQNNKMIKNSDLPKIKFNKSMKTDAPTGFQPVNPLFYHDVREKVANEKLSMMGTTPSKKKILHRDSTGQKSHLPSDMEPNRNMPTQFSMPSLITEGSYTAGKRQSALPQIDVKMMKNDGKMNILHNKYRKLQRIRELTEWAKNDYGIEIKHVQRGTQLTEAEFILKVKEKYIVKRNNQAALKLQSVFKGFVVRTRYRQERDAKVYGVTKLQSLGRMWLARRRYLDLRSWWKSSAALTIQKYCRGRIGRRQFEDYKRFEMVDVLADMVGSMKRRHELDLAVKLSYAWSKHKIKVAKKKAKAKKKKAAGKKKGSIRTGASSTMNSTLVSQKSTASNLGKTATSIQSSNKTDTAKDATLRQDTIGESGAQAIQEEDGEPAENEDDDNLSRADGENPENEDDEDPTKNKEDLEKDGYKVQDYTEARLSNANS